MNSQSIVIVLSPTERDALLIGLSNTVDHPDAMMAVFSNTASREACWRAANKLRNALTVQQIANGKTQ